MYDYMTQGVNIFYGTKIYSVKIYFSKVLIQFLIANEIFTLIIYIVPSSVNFNFLTLISMVYL